MLLKLSSSYIVIHAFSGCDTTSGIFEKSNTSILKLIEKSPEAQARATKFLVKGISQEEVGNAGIELFVLLYGGKIGDSLQILRYASYMKMAASATKVNPSKLPPTERTAYFHSLRAYLQVIL